MLLREYLLDNAHKLKGHVFDWTFGGSKYEMKIVSETSLEYRAPGRKSWDKSTIMGIRKFTILSLEMGRRRILHAPKIHIKTDNPRI